MSASTEGSPRSKRVSTIHVAILHRIKSGKYKVSHIEGAEHKHEAFMWRFFGALNQTSHDRSGISRQALKNLLNELYPDRSYRTYYNSIIFVRMRPRRLF